MLPRSSSDLDTSELHFAAGLPGFPDHHRFTLNWWGDSDLFSILRSVDDSSVEFVVVPPFAFFPTYEPELDDTTAERLNITTSEDALVLVIVTLGDRPEDATANLMAPIVINQHSLEATQAVLVGGGYDLRARLGG
ncbi:MAG: flagellar assembly protein FliW [Acidobacteria bacterium]|nr:flagellar assembly protein FliW [Acidobacteriota bacterium]